MTDVIDFFFDIWVSLFALIKSYWILAGFLLINVMKLIIDLVKQSKSQ